MRVGFVGVKGGTGKTTISLYIAMKLAGENKVLFIDKDLLGWGSKLLGFRGMGYCKTKGEAISEFYKQYDNLGVLKFFGDISSYFKCDKYFDEAKLIEIYKKYDYFIVDYGEPYLIRHNISAKEIEFFKSEIGTRIGTVSVSDPFPPDVKENVNMMNELSKELNSDKVAFVINLVPPLPDELELAREQASEIGDWCKCKTFVIPFLEELFWYRGRHSFQDIEEINHLFSYIRDYLKNKVA
ncbi:hypothetical protein HS7_01680 [Sulfolobales archaeon HS-7]|nr:hypothetical protein HS7_01680 [Sulfolobales archaeon HS-7]